MPIVKFQSNENTIKNFINFSMSVQTEKIMFTKKLMEFEIEFDLNYWKKWRGS